MTFSRSGRTQPACRRRRHGRLASVLLTITLALAPVAAQSPTPLNSALGAQLEEKIASILRHAETASREARLTTLLEPEINAYLRVQGAPLVITRLVEITAGQVHRGEYPMDIAVVVIQGEREPQVLLGLVPGFVAVGAPAMNPRLGQGTSPPGMGVGAFGVELDGPIQQALDLLLSTLVER